jgi:hypothetical protein
LPKVKDPVAYETTGRSSVRLTPRGILNPGMVLPLFFLPLPACVASPLGLGGVGLNEILCTPYRDFPNVCWSRLAGKKPAAVRDHVLVANHEPAGFFPLLVAFFGFSGGGGSGARSIDNRRPAMKR